jgi:hypothetical protein
MNDGTFQINDCGIGKIFNETYNQCVDINECANSPCRPNERCINTDGSYRCASACDPGYQLNNFSKIISIFYFSSHLIPSVQEQGINIK